MAKKKSPTAADQRTGETPGSDVAAGSGSQDA